MVVVASSTALTLAMRVAISAADMMQKPAKMEKVMRNHTHSAVATMCAGHATENLWKNFVDLHRSISLVLA